MNNIVDIEKERRISALVNDIATRCANNPAMAARTRSMLNGELPVMTQKPNPLAIRLPAPLIDRLDELTEKLNADPQRGMERVFKRTDTLREALVRGIKEIESDLESGRRP